MTTPFSILNKPMSPGQINILRRRIAEKVPQNRLVLQPGEDHVYNDSQTGASYVSVTTRMKILNNPHHSQWRINRVLEYLKDHHQEITKENIDEILRQAREYPETLFKEAGTHGTSTHGYLEKMINEWMKTDEKPDWSTIVSDEKDFRCWSALRSFSAWTDKEHFVPLASELQVWSPQYHIAGTLDCVGLIRGRHLAIIDFKTSNEFSDSYWMQVAAYWHMFYETFRRWAHTCIILKLDKCQGIPQTEEIDDPMTRFNDYLHVIALDESMRSIAEARKNHNRGRNTVTI